MHQKPFLAALLCAVPSIAVAQRIDLSPAIATQNEFGVAWVDGELLAGSRTYKARFEPGAVELTPALGRTAPRTYPLRVSLRSVRRGQHEVLTVAPAGAPAPRLMDESVLYRYGDDIVERYEVRAEGLKQSVVFAQRPGGLGDLVLRYAIATDMECAPTDRARELSFRAADLGGIEIGAVAGIDANGRRAEGHMGFDGQQLELVLPHEFVESASYPLEVDPLFGPQLNTGVSFDDHFPDIAYDATNNIYGIVFEFPISATSSDVWIMRHDALTGNRLGGTSVGSGQGSQRHPGIASINQSDRFLVVWQDDGSGNGDIKCRGVRPTDGALTQTVTVSGTPAAELAPDVGGDAFDNLDLEALVVWQETGVGIRGIQVTLPVGTGDPVVMGTAVTLDPSPQSANPTISKSGGFDPSNGGRYVVAWEATISGSAMIGFLGVDRDLNALTPPAYIPGGFGASNPDVDGNGTQFLLVFEVLEAIAPAPSDIWCQPLAFCSAGTALCGPTASGLVYAGGNDEREPAVAFLGPMYAVAWSDANPGSSTDYRIGITNVVPGTCRLCNALGLTGPSTGWHSSHPALCAKRSGGTNSEEALLSWEEKENSTGNTLLRSHRYRPFTGGSVTQVPGVGGCGTGGTCGVGSPFAVGNSWFKFTLQGADPSASVAFLLLDTMQGAPGSCGTCTFINPLVLVSFVPVTNGQAEVPLPLPCAPGLLGFTMDAQWLVITPGSATPPCPMFPFVSLSNAIRLVLGN